MGCEMMRESANIPSSKGGGRLPPKKMQLYMLMSRMVSTYGGFYFVVVSDRRRSGNFCRGGHTDRCDRHDVGENPSKIVQNEAWIGPKSTPNAARARAAFGVDFGLSKPHFGRFWTDFHQHHDGHNGQCDRHGKNCRTCALCFRINSGNKIETAIWPAP